MTKMMIEIDSEDYNKLRDLCEKINNTDKPVLYPFYTVNTTEMVAVPQFEGDEREYMIEGRRVLGKEVGKYLTDHEMTFDEFKEKAIHTCDYKGLERLEGCFLTEDACYDYIDDNIAELRQPYPYCKSFGKNKEMIELVKLLFRIAGVEASQNWVEPDPVKIIENNIRNCAESHGLGLTDNVTKIARAKNMMFGVDEWHRCCCDHKNGDRFCMSEQCQQDVEEKGVCFCNLYKKKD